MIANQVGYNNLARGVKPENQLLKTNITYNFVAHYRTYPMDNCLLLFFRDYKLQVALSNPPVYS